MPVETAAPRSRNSAMAALRPMLLLGLALLAGMPAARAAEGSTPPYEGDLLKLAEFLGALHYLRPLCGAGSEAQSWRGEMQALIDAEQPSEARKARMIDAFNQGYNSYAQVYRVCTPAAVEAVQRQMQEGERLAHDIVVRYGGN